LPACFVRNATASAVVCGRSNLNCGRLNRHRRQNLRFHFAPDRGDAAPVPCS
jgi:hypothetical protein